MLDLLKKFVLASKNNLKYYYKQKINGIDYNEKIIDLLLDSDKRLEQCSKRIDNLLHQLENKNDLPENNLINYFFVPSRPQFKLSLDYLEIFIILNLKKHFPDYKIKCIYDHNFRQYCISFTYQNLTKEFKFNEVNIKLHFKEFIECLVNSKTLKKEFFL